MNRADPFTGYSFLLRTLVYVVIPAFGIWQFFRLRKALHVFQLEGYKRARFLQWARANPRRALWLAPATAKKPLVMTGRAWRLLATSTVTSVLLVYAPAGIAHVAVGWPLDVMTALVMMGLVFYRTSHVMALADLGLSPVQRAVNASYLRSARRKLRSQAPLVIGVTGSFGKTSTKFAIAGLLDDADGALATPGSFNTPLGVCRAINENMDESVRYFVVEMGAYKEGEIAELCRFVEPKIAVLTAIGPAHLERFGSMDAIRRAKYEIVTSLPPDGVAVMNVDDPEVRTLADKTKSPKVVRYGLDPEGHPDVTARDVAVSASGTSFTIVVAGESLNVSTRLLGRHAVGHVLAGAAVALSAGRALPDLKGAVESLQPVEHRLQLIRGTGGVVVIDDAFNSNPDGAEAALEVLAAMPGGRKVVVTPGIIELGELQEAANVRFGERAGAIADTLIVVSKINRDALVRGAKAADGAEVVVVDTLEDATAKLSGLLTDGDIVLFENDLPDQYEG